MHNQKEDNNQSKTSKQPEVPENQTAWNSDQGIKERVNQNNQTTKVVDRRTWGEALTEWKTETQSGLWTMAGRGVAMVGETPSITGQSIGKGG